MLNEDPEYLLRSRKMKRMAEYYSESVRRKYDLRQIDVDVLAYLASHRDTTACEIARTLDLHKGQLSEALKHLVQKEYAVEYHDPNDHRYVHYEATERGKPLAQMITSYKKQLKKQMFRGFTDDEMHELKRLMNKLAANVDEMLEN